MTSEIGRWAEPSLLVLASLAEGPKHGYAITQDVATSLGVTLGPGTLYGAIARLEQRGLIEALPPDQRRRPYRITAAGASELAGQAERMRDLAALGLARLGRQDRPSRQAPGPAPAPRKPGGPPGRPGSTGMRRRDQDPGWSGSSSRLTRRAGEPATAMSSPRCSRT